MGENSDKSLESDEERPVEPTGQGDEPDSEHQGKEDLSGEDAVEGDAIELLKGEIAALREALLRTRAEAENVRKRGEREVEKIRRYGQDRVIQDLLPVIDSLDQGLDAGARTSAEKLAEGMEMTRKMLLKVLEQQGLDIIDPKGDRFDPNWHEAMTTQPSAEHEPNTVLQVLQKGFRLNDRLLRPARVIVSKDPEA